jgi:hypothetical protein
MINRFSCGTLGLAALLSLAGFSATAAQSGTSPDDNCTAIEGWFPHDQTPAPDSAHFTADSACSFHRWSWQMFLWLTQEVDGKPRFLSFQSPYTLLNLDNRSSMLPRLEKSASPRALDEYLQAGTEGIMIDQNGRSLYYSQYLNDTFVSFVQDQKLLDPEVVRQFDPQTPFPVDTLELKASWKVVMPGENTDGFFTMPSSVYKLVNRDGAIVVDDTQPIDATLALVGFHIGGVVKDHPEMIWATFEHKDNAPDVPATFDADTPISDRDWTFYKANTPYSGCNINPAKSVELKLDEATQTLTPITQVCRRYAFGNDPNQTTQSVPTNIADVKRLNASVLSQLSGEDVWSNYFEIGAIWFAPGATLEPNMPLATDTQGSGTNKQQLLTGSLKLSNAAVETFTQSQSTMNNCFRCHNTLQRFPPKTSLDPLPGLNLNISHAFVNLYFWSQELAQQKQAGAQ